MVVSWNSCKKGASAAARICRHIHSQFGDFFGLLQEVPAWCKLNNCTYSRHTVVSLDGFDCGLLIPRRWMPAIRSTSLDAYWCGAVVGKTIFISAHVLDHLEEDGRADVVFQETCNYTNDIRGNFSNMEFKSGDWCRCKCPASTWSRQADWCLCETIM